MKTLIVPTDDPCVFCVALSDESDYVVMTGEEIVKAIKAAIDSVKPISWGAD